MAKKNAKKKSVKKSGGSKTPKTAVDLSLNGIKEFIKFARQFPVSKLSAGQTGARLTVYQNPAVSKLKIKVEEKEPAETAQTDALAQIKSDRVGVFHGVKNLKIGSKVKAGETVAKIHAIGIEDEIKAEKNCVIKEILAQENDLIEYGQPLFLIE
jgi:acetyl-CoA carboxylase biotin carboxyl carrier protein